MTSWIPIADDSDFSIHNIPFGVFRTKDNNPRVGVAIGSKVIDLKALGRTRLLDTWPYETKVFSRPFLNGLMAYGRPAASALRARLQHLLSEGNDELRSRDDLDEIIFDQSEVEMMLPVNVRDYTDFYSSLDHATNVGKMFRDPENALLPNWKHIPVGYHGRASSIIVSGTDFHRPKGQLMPVGADKPEYGPCKLLDIELEMAFITCKPNKLGHAISTTDADEHIWGMVLFNDWSARDIQKWEYVPLGPFLGKSFASSISPWIVLIDALEPFRVAGPDQEPQVLPYLQYSGDKHIDINLEVYIKTQKDNDDGSLICQSNFKHMYWNMNQQLAHHTVNGCNINVGDMYGSGTISGPNPSSFGSLLELSWKGSKTIELQNGQTRKFLQDGDTVIMKGHASKDGKRVGFGEVRTKVLPAI